MYVPTHAYLHVGVLQVCVPLFACVVLCLFVCVGCVCFGPRDQYPVPRLVEWFTRETVQTKLNRNKLQLSPQLWRRNPEGAHYGRGGESSFLTSMLLIWHLSPVLYFRRGKTDSSRGTENRAEARRIRSRHIHRKAQNTIVCFSNAIKHTHIYIHIWVHGSKQQQHTLWAHEAGETLVRTILGLISATPGFQPEDANIRAKDFIIWYGKRTHTDT